MRLLRPLTLAAAALAAAACASDAPTVPADAALAAREAAAARADNPSALNKQLAAVRAATARYHRVEAAEADLYVRVSDCVALPGVGGMGYHYARFDLVDARLDVAQPEVLVYAPLPNGELKLVAAEYLMPAAAGPRPTLYGQLFEDGPPDLPFPSYALHAWVWEHNPSGMFAAFNPSVSCPATSAPTAATGHEHH